MHEKEKNRQLKIHRPLLYDKDCCSGFFDGESQEEATHGGVGSRLWLNDSLYYKINFNCGPGINIRSKHMALCILIYFGKS